MAYINDKNLPYLVEKLSNADNIKINNNKHGSRVSTVINSLVTKSDNVTKAIEQEIINDSYSFKVGTGDVNVSADVQDGFGEIGIKGVTYQNILGARINPSNGVEKNNNTITFNKVAQTNCVAGFPDSLAQVDKTYTLIFDILENTIENPTNGNVGKINIVSYNSGNYFIKYKETGHKKILLKQPATSTGKPYVEFYNETSGKFVMTTPILLEGDHTNNPNLPSYFEGIVGVGDKSKNLFNYKLHDSIEYNGSYYTIVKERWKSNTVEYTVEPNTDYTISVDRYEGNLWLSFDVDGVQFNNNNYSKFSKVIRTNETGKLLLRVGANTSADVGHKFINLQLEKGTVATQYEPHYDGHKIEILSHGKNLFNNKNNFITGGSGFAQTVGQMVTLSEIGDSNHKYLQVKLPIGKKYTVTIDKRNTYPDGWSNTIIESISDNIIVGSTYKTIARNNNSSSQISMLTFETSMPYVFIHIGRKNNDQAYEEWFAKVLESFETMQIEENDTSSEFEPYIEDKTQILLDKPLMRLPNGICDEITRDGKLIKRVGKIIFNGSENWKTAINNNKSRFDLSLNSVKTPSAWNDKTVPNMICSNLNVQPFVQIYAQGKSGITFYHANSDRLIVASLGNSCSLVEFKQWLSQNPTTVYYELAEPIITELPAPYLRMFKDGHLRFNTLVAPESNHVVQLNKSAQIERSIREVQSLNGRVGQLESFYDNMMLETSYKLNLLNYDFEYTKEREDK